MRWLLRLFKEAEHKARKAPVVRKRGRSLRLTPYVRQAILEHVDRAIETGLGGRVSKLELAVADLKMDVETLERFYDNALRPRNDDPKVEKAIRVAIRNQETESDRRSGVRVSPRKIRSNL